MRNKEGLTLIEVVVVVFVVVVLMSFSIVIYQRSLQMAKRAKCTNNLKQIYQALIMYLEDNNDVPPIAKGVDENSFQGQYLKDILCPKYADEKIFYCPCDPRDTEEIRRTGSYDWRSSIRDIRFSQIQNKGDVIIIGDFRGGWHDVTIEGPLKFVSNWALEEDTEEEVYSEKDYINVLYADGHVDLVTIKKWQDNIGREL
ncbi:DUF1559 domain-containing protein [bacterium]|nr:DUF1559 domain-containing protein [bacterium]